MAAKQSVRAGRYGGAVPLRNGGSVVTTVQVKSAHFCAGLVVRDGLVIEAAPIIGYMKGWRSRSVLRYLARKGWSYEVVRREVARDALARVMHELYCGIQQERKT